MSAMIIDLMYISTSSAEEPDYESPDENLPKEEPKQEINLRHVLAEYRKLYLMNNDMVGFVRIPGTLIEYPLMQHTENDYYDHHNFYRELDRKGCLSIDKSTNLNQTGINIIINSNALKEQSLLEEMNQYKDETFYKKHKTIYLDTLYEQREYEVISVFLTKEHKPDYSGFHCHRDYQHDSKEMFEYFQYHMKSLSLYETGIEAKKDGEYITFSSYNDYTQKGRLAVVAMRVK